MILRGFGPDACLVVPLTTSPREHALRLSVGVVDGKPAKANISQMRVVDTRRLEEKAAVSLHSPRAEARGEAEANCAYMIPLCSRKANEEQKSSCHLTSPGDPPALPGRQWQFDISWSTAARWNRRLRK